MQFSVIQNCDARFKVKNETLLGQIKFAVTLKNEFDYEDKLIKSARNFRTIKLLKH